jgi:sensor histidine kinase YesM
MKGFWPFGLCNPLFVGFLLKYDCFPDFYGMMKRVLLHSVFWLVYLLQDTVLEVEWVGPALKNIPDNVQFLMALKAAIAAWLPKLLFTYFILYVAIKQILAGRIKLHWIILQVMVAVIITIVFYRLLFVYYINPVVYLNLLTKRPLFYVLGILLAVMDIGFVSGVAITLKLLRMQLLTREREKNLIKEKLEAELKFLRHQTNPHFLFNTLNNIYALARKRSEHTAEVVLRLSKLLRFILYESKSNLITVADELKILDDYIELEKMRYERLTINFQRDIDDSTQKIAPLLLLPFVENAFKHGASESRFDSFISIQVKGQQGRLTFTIENTKENNTSEEIRDNIGLCNVRRQLELMYKEYDLQLTNEPHIFSVRLYINLTSYAQV